MMFALLALVGLTSFDVQPLPNDNGRHLHATWKLPDGRPPGAATVILRAPPPAPPGVAIDAGTTLAAGAAQGPWTVVAILEAGEVELTDEVEPDTAYTYAAVEITRTAEGAVLEASPAATAGPRAAEAAWIHTGRLGFLAIIVMIGLLVQWYVRAIRKNKDLYIRRLPGVEAIEDSIGRSTEMGRPVLYCTGLEETQNIQTLASVLILGHVAERAALYDTDLVVANYYPLTRVVAEEVVRQGYANAGRIDAHRPENVLYITAEQFAFAAALSGMILRERPATLIYFGGFYGESLLLAETGFLTGAVQIAGTAELTQLPFFITACDYTLIGEELYAASAYLTREPMLLANLKAGDAFKITAMAFIVTGVVLATAAVYALGPAVFP